MPPVAPTPTMFPIAAVPPSLPVQDYILPGGSNQMIPNQEIHPELTFKGPAGFETGLKGFMPGPGSMDHARSFPQQRFDGSFQRGDTNTFPNNFGNRRSNVREQGGRFNHGWNSHRGFNARENINMQARVGPRNFMRPPPPPPPFVGPSPAFINAPGFHGKSFDRSNNRFLMYSILIHLLFLHVGVNFSMRNYSSMCNDGGSLTIAFCFFCCLICWFSSVLSCKHTML